ncbi:MAG: site-specific integrase, partial [Alphaproteobacteria bacterium]
MSRTFTHKRDALEWAREMELKADRRGMPQNHKVLEQMTLEELLKKYRDTVIVQKKGKKNESVILNAFIRNSICKKSLAEITSEDFEKYRRVRLKSVLGSTVNREFHIIQHAYNVAINVWELPIPKNPLASIANSPEPSPRARRLSEAERKRLIAHAGTVKNPYIALIIKFALGSVLIN